MRNSEFQGVKVSAWPDAPSVIAPEKPRKPQPTDLPVGTPTLMHIAPRKADADIRPQGILRGSCNRPSGFSAWGKSQDLQTIVRIMKAMR